MPVMISVIRLAMIPVMIPGMILRVIILAMISVVIPVRIHVIILVLLSSRRKHYYNTVIPL